MPTETARAAAKRDVHVNFVAGYQAATKTAEIGPDTQAARTWRQNFKRTARAHGSDGALPSNTVHLKLPMPARPWHESHTVRYRFTISSLRLAMAPSATIAPRSMT